MGLKPKRCFVCGRVFVPTVNNQICCRDECTAEYKYEYKRLYWDDMLQEMVDPEIDDYIGDNVFITKEQLLSSPNLSDRIKVRRVLSDFGIKCEMPSFKTFKEMNDWKNEKLAIIGH